MARARGYSARVLIFLIFLLSFGAFVYGDGPPVIHIYPDDLPVHVNLFFPAGSPLERFTSQKDAWYAIYQTSLYPGYAYTIIMRHKGDPARMKVYVMDNHPFGKVSVKMQLAMKRTDNGYRGPAYEAVVSLPEKTRFSDLFLLLEWHPSSGNDRPVPVSLQVVSTGYGQFLGRGRQWGTNRTDWIPESSMQGRRPIVIPFPER